MLTIPFALDLQQSKIIVHWLTCRLLRPNNSSADKAWKPGARGGCSHGISRCFQGLHLIPALALAIRGCVCAASPGCHMSSVS